MTSHGSDEDEMDNSDKEQDLITPLTLECRINGGVPNKLVGVEIFSYQYEKFPKVRLGGGWKGAKNDYLGQ